LAARAAENHERQTSMNYEYVSDGPIIASDTLSVNGRGLYKVSYTLLAYVKRVLAAHKTAKDLGFDQNDPLYSFVPSKIEAIKKIRESTGWGLKDSKDFYELLEKFSNS
jgi:hypothetical protein